MLLLCLSCSVVAGVIAMFYTFERISYQKIFNLI